MTQQPVDTTTLFTIWHAFQTTCHEMRHLVSRTAQSYLMGQLKDLSVGIWTAEGEAVAVPVGLPVQFLGNGLAVRDILKKFENDLEPGDVILTNDPYHGGHNCHLPDWGFLKPIFFEGELLYVALCRGHQQDTGGSFPGGYFANGFDIHAEGLIIPPTKVYSAGKIRTDVMELIWHNVRFSGCVQIDNAAMVAALNLADRRMQKLLGRYGKETVANSIQEMFGRTEAAVRKEILQIPDGTYLGDAATDDDGTELDVPVHVRAEVTVHGDSVTIDFSKSDAQRKGFINSVYAATYANAVAAVCLTLDPSIADYHNEGTMRCIKVIAPEGSVTNCRYPATVGASPVNIGNQTMESVLEALGQARKERAVASWGKHRGDYVFAVDPRTNERYVRTTFDYDGSGGAVWGHDGYQGLAGMTTLGAVARGNVEEVEVRIPWEILRWEYATDRTGPGRWRGGPGMIWEARHYGLDAGISTGSSDGDEMLGFGAAGGNPSPPSRMHIRRGDELIRVKPHRNLKMEVNDIVIKDSSGGGGVGPAWERDPAAVQLDVKKGLVSIQGAERDYMVAIDPATGEVDLAGTERLRAPYRA